MRHCALIITILTCLHAPFQAQSLRAYERAGDSAFKQKDYGAAIQYYGDILKRHEDNLALWWKYGESARLYFALPEAERSYKKIQNSKKHRNRHPLVDYRMAEVKKSQGDYKAAIAFFEQFLAEQPNADPAFFEMAKTEIQRCYLAESIAAEPSEVSVVHLGKKVNSPWYEFAPSIVGDTLFYSSYRFDKKNKRSKTQKKLSKVMISSKGGRGREPGRGFPATDTAHVAHTAFSPDGHYMFFTVCSDINANDKHCDLWMTLIDRRNRWLPPVKLPEPVNIPGYSTTQPNIGYDEDVQGPVLWFASDRPGGLGKFDLWQVALDTNFFCECNLPLPGKKDIKLPRFNTPTNVVAVNTPENDVTPFFYEKTQKLYFSSEGLPGLGGFDIFFSEKDSTGFTAPENAGTGFNTSYNDLYLVLKKDGKAGFLSSNRSGALYLDERNKACCNDIFSFSIKSSEQPKIKDSTDIPVLVAKTPAIEKPSAISPIPVEPTLADYHGLPLFFDNDEPDRRTRKSVTKRSYSETVHDYLDRQTEYKTRFAAGLSSKQEIEAETLVDDFFDNEVRRGSERLDQLCDLMLVKLQAGEKLEVVVKGFTSPRAKSDYNLKLAKRRISSVRNQLENFSDGQLKPFLLSGDLSISELSFGETTAKTSISDKLTDERNSIYHPDAARERRVEIVEVIIR